MACAEHASISQLAPTVVQLYKSKSENLWDLTIQGKLLTSKHIKEQDCRTEVDCGLNGILHLTRLFCELLRFILDS